MRKTVSGASSCYPIKDHWAPIGSLGPLLLAASIPFTMQVSMVKVQAWERRIVVLIAEMSHIILTEPPINMFTHNVFNGVF